MKALSIDNQTLAVQEIDITMAANTVYTFFSSILIDELAGLKEHVIYADANALSEKKKPYFIGEQLVLGDALILGRDGFDDVDAKIAKKELLALIHPDVNAFYKEVLELLADTDINLYKTFTVEKNGEKIALNTEWVLYTFNIADERTKEYFINELQKAVTAKSKVAEYMQKMAQLAMNVAA
ncbi:hypothetical protein FJR45_01145 [Sulfurimonas sediminis]|uniref:Uncharacterized protein n=1 Tax=Sulfurimonas sediminis TaxID=2590020 RepID=A0A7M1AYV2_9BACT|nr:hypothetical protein [Sulfurimonas sediminis]QOP42630.1 hypothetical protein FJR45_01145 [Sulfurimonas sediminis]